MNCSSGTRRGRRTLTYVALALATLITGCVDELMQPGDSIVTAGASGPAAAAAPAQARAGDRIPGQYVVLFTDDVADAPGLARALTQRHGGAVLQEYTAAVKGFSARLTEAAASALQHNPSVASIELDQVVTTTGSIQAAAPWALDRVDQASLPLDTRYEYSHTGAGVHVYIIDSGIRTSHFEFTGRIGAGTTFVDDGYGVEDCMGHGTHVAGIAGGATYGVAKGVTLHPVRVFSCSGGTSGSTVLAAVDWVTRNAERPAVVNMSLGGGASYSLNQAVAASIASGITYAVSAGNLNTDACNQSPASAPEALTVAASTSTDSAAFFSNWGSCVDLYAPGLGILSAGLSSDDGTRTMSGTSMASPLVAGAAALYLEARPGATPTQISNAIVTSATQRIILPRMSSTNNSLLNVTSMLSSSGGDTPIREKPGGGPGTSGKGKGKR